MANIREDLEGIALAVSETGQPVILRAGDEIPEGIEVDELLVSQSKPASGNDPGSATSAPDAVSPALPPRGGPGSGAAAWRAYGETAAKALGFEIDIPADATKTDIIEALRSVDIPVE